MLRNVDTRDPAAVESEVGSIYAALFPDGDPAFVAGAFRWVLDSFRGGLPEYRPLDVGYHDIEHTLQGTLCLSRLLQGRQRAGAEPRLTAKAFELGLLAILFHDTGYLKRRSDMGGTGAKYTVVHVDRSAAFARDFLLGKGFSESEVVAVQNMIHCTGVATDVQAIPFQNELERTVGYALGTADLLGQMAATDYVEKLPLLFNEFTEAAPHATGRAAQLFTFESAEALMRNTPVFWEHHVRPKIEQEFGGVYAFLNDPYPDGPNPYVQRIEKNIARLRP
jgi:hypothetical protein